MCIRDSTCGYYASLMDVPRYKGNRRYQLVIMIIVTTFTKRLAMSTKQGQLFVHLQAMGERQDVSCRFTSGTDLIPRRKATYRET